MLLYWVCADNPIASAPIQPPGCVAMKDKVLLAALFGGCLAGIASAQTAPPASPKAEQAITPWTVQPILTSKGARAVLAAAQEEAARNHWGMSIAIVDQGGRLLGFERMDGAPLGTIDVAQ